MKKIVYIHQPDFAPWLGFFDKLKKSDVYIVLDDVQFLNKGWHNRDKIKGPSGVIWLTVPVKKKGRYRQLIKDTEIENSIDWKRKHLKMFKLYYSRAKNFNRIFDKLSNVYNKQFNYLIDLNFEIILLIIQELKIEGKKIMFSSDFNLKSKGVDKILDLLNIVGASDYITGLPSKEYINEEKFNKTGIKIIWHKYNTPIYKQLFGDFIPNLSTIDFLFNKSKKEESNEYNRY